MDNFTGKYQHYKNETIDDFYIAVGVPLMARKMMSMSSPTMEIKVDGETITISTKSIMRTTENTFTFGEEYEEKMPTTSLKNIAKKLNDNEFIIESVVPDSGEKCTRHYLFTEEECIITMTHEKAKTPGKRFFRRIK